MFLNRIEKKKQVNGAHLSMLHPVGIIELKQALHEGIRDIPHPFFKIHCNNNLLNELFNTYFYKGLCLCNWVRM